MAYSTSHRYMICFTISSWWHIYTLQLRFGVTLAEKLFPHTHIGNRWKWGSDGSITMQSHTVTPFSLSSCNNIFVDILNSILYAIFVSHSPSDFNLQNTYRLCAQYLNSYCQLILDNICTQLIPKVAWMSQFISHVMSSHVMYAKITLETLCVSLYYLAK